MKPLVINLSLFKVGWLAAVFAAASMLPALGTLAVLVVSGVHLYRAEHWQAELKLLVTAAVIGTVWESIVVQAGLLTYSTGTLAEGMAPYWIVAMWVLFATTLNIGMRWLRRSWLIAAVAGAVGGPLSFIAGEKTGAVTFTDPASALLVISAGWAVILPVLVQIADALEVRHTGFRDQSSFARES